MLERDPAKFVAAEPDAGKAKAARTPTRTATAKPAARKTASKRTARKPKAGTALSADLQARIRERAYELWEHDGRPEGRDHAHWQQAEREVGTARADG